MKMKLTVNSLALKNLIQRKKQYSVLIISVILAMTFVSGIPFFISCMNSSQEEMRYRRLGKQDYIYLNAQAESFSSIKNTVTNENVGYAEILSRIYPENGGYEKGIYVAAFDKNASELYYRQLTDGRFPEKENEIAAEETALLMLGDNIKVGDSIKVSENIFSDGTFSDTAESKTYILTGIISDKKLFLENLYSNAYKKVKNMPSVYVSDVNEINLTSSKNIMAFVKTKSDDAYHNFLAFEADPENTLNTTEMFASNIGDAYRNIMTSMGTLIFMSFLLAALSCFAIVNAFNSNLKSRKNQIGLLKAVGATRRQIITVFSREAIIIAVLTTPLSLLISYFSVKLAAQILGENFIFIPDFRILLLSAVFGLLCVMFSALIPLIKASKLSPMHAIRDIDTLRKVKNKKIVSKTSFNAPRHIAKRKLIFAGKKRIIVTVMVSITILFSSLAGSFIKISAEEAVLSMQSDYKITDMYANYDIIYSSNSCINTEVESPITEIEKQLCFDIPQIQSVFGTKTCRANILFEDDIPLYLTVNDIASINSGARYPEAKHILIEDVLSSDISVKEKDKTQEIIDIIFKSPANIESPIYSETKEKAGYTQNFFNTCITASSEKLIEELKNNIIDGKIDIKKLNSGEEIILRAPEEIGFSIEVYPDKNGYIYSLENMAFENSAELSKAQKNSFDNVVLKAQCPFKAGDKITVSVITEENGAYNRKDRTFTVGAIVGKNINNGKFGLLTTLSGLDSLGVSMPYCTLDIDLKEECDNDIDSQITSKLQVLFPGKDVESAFAINENLKSDHRTLILALTSLVLVFGAVCISLISNTVTANIRESKKMIGTLRAVGCSKRELFDSYMTQIADMIFWGSTSGIILYIFTYLILNSFVITDIHLPFSVLPVICFIPALIAVCTVNLKSKLNAVTKYSIVENIREL